WRYVRRDNETIRPARRMKPLRRHHRRYLSYNCQSNTPALVRETRSAPSTTSQNEHRPHVLPVDHDGLRFAGPIWGTSKPTTSDDGNGSFSYRVLRLRHSTEGVLRRSTIDHKFLPQK